MLPSTWRGGCCAIVRTRRTLCRKPCCGRTGFSETFVERTAGPGCCRSCVTVCYTWLEKRVPADLVTEFDEEIHQGSSPNPETLAAQADERQQLMNALESLPIRSREVLVLRELEGCSYKEVSEVTGIPLGTVMSTLSRARERLQRTLGARTAKEASGDL
jgi:sigma-70-like protein